MLSPKTQTNLANAKTYFEEHLAVSDYYAGSERVCGRWIGEGAAALGLQRDVDREAFVALCDNTHPHTGKRLTMRRKTTRRELAEDGRERTVANRRVFYDFTFSPPKSVSVAALLGNDERIVNAHRAAVTIAMSELERFASVQVHGKVNLLELIETRGARVILSGDTRQHGPVEASDALRAIERYSGLRPAELNTIRRQDPKRARDHAERQRIREYRAAVKEA